MTALLRNHTLGLVDESIARPCYERTSVPGILHFGAGAFHRAHQAEFVDRILPTDPRWGICAVSLQSDATVQALAAQDGLYTLTLLDETRKTRIIGSITAALGGHDDEAILKRFRSPDLRLITATVTEKAYAAGSEFIGRLTAGLAARRAAGLAPLTVMSCDNLPGNGVTLRGLVIARAEAIDPALASWIGAETRFPNTMVDSITPRTDGLLRAHVIERIGLRDEAPVHREPFAAWIIEDNFAGERPPLEVGGAQFVSDVSGFEAAKLRLLNAAHSAIAYLGLLRGHETVSAAMNDAALARFIDALMRRSTAPLLQAPQGLVLERYIDTILTRFRNPGVAHQLGQIAMDGSQKLPARLFGTLRETLARNGEIDPFALVIAAWFRVLQRAQGEVAVIADPLADALAGPAAAGAVDQLLSLEQVFGSDLPGSKRLREAVTQCFADLAEPARFEEILTRLGDERCG